LDIAPWEAVLGASISVPTLEGEVNIKIPPGTTTGTKLRLRGRGLRAKDSAGDLIVNARVQTPTSVAPDVRKLWEQLAQESKFNPRD
jgi:curved DNA-binding protein